MTALRAGIVRAAFWRYSRLRSAALNTASSQLGLLELAELASRRRIDVAPNAEFVRSDRRPATLRPEPLTLAGFGKVLLGWRAGAWASHFCHLVTQDVAP